MSEIIEASFRDPICRKCPFAKVVSIEDYEKNMFEIRMDCSAETIAVCSTIRERIGDELEESEE